MKPNEDKEKIQGDIKKLLQNLPTTGYSEGKRREFISRLFNIPAEKKAIFKYSPFKTVSALAGALAAVLILIYIFSPLCPVVDGVKGTVKVYRRARNEWILAEKSKIKLKIGDIVKSFEGSQADITLSSLYQMRLKQNSEIKLTKTYSRILAGDTGYDLTKGDVFAYYKKREKEKKEFGIETPNAHISAVGTDFMVQSLPDLGKTWVGVLDGIVKVRGIGVAGDISKIKETAVFVKPGEKTVVHAGNPPTKPERLMEDELLELEELYRIGTKPQVSLLISTGKNRVRELLTVTPLYIHTDTPDLSRKVEELVTTFSEAIKERAKDKHMDSIKQLEDIVNNNPNPKYDTQFLLFIGAYYQYAAEYTKSIDTFQKVVTEYPKSNLASLAQCAIGIIYEEKLNDKEEAGKAYQKVISLYPKSPEVEEAASGLERLAR